MNFANFSKDAAPGRRKFPTCKPRRVGHAHVSLPLASGPSLPPSQSILLAIKRKAVYLLIVIQSFRCAESERLFRRDAVRRFKAIERPALRKLDMLDAAPDIRTLSMLPGNRLERLKGDRKGHYSIRINDQWRVCFEWRNGHAYDVEIVDYH